MSPEIARHQRRDLYLVLLLLTVSSFLLFYRLSDIEMKPWDESVYALRSKEMYLSRSFLAPIQDGKVAWSSGKPPLGFWLIIASFHLFAINPFSLRLPFAIAGLGCIFLVFLIGKQLAGRRMGILAALSLLLMPGFLLYCRRAILEPLLTFLFLSALFLYHRSWVTSSPRSFPLFALGSGMAIGLAMLAKQVVGLIVLPAILIHDFLEGKPGKVRPLLSRRSSLALLAALATSGWWFLLMYLLHGPLFLNHYFGINVFRRLTHTITARSTKLTGFPALLFQHAGPLAFWVGLGGILLLLFLAVRIYRSRRLIPLSAASASLLIPLLLFSTFYYLVFGQLSRTLLFWYPFPLLPLFALGQGYVLTEAMAIAENSRTSGHLSLFSGVLPLLPFWLSLSQRWYLLCLASFLLFSIWVICLRRCTDIGERFLPLLGLLSLTLYFSLSSFLALGHPTYHAPDPYPQVRRLVMDLGTKEVVFDKDLKGKIRHKIYPLRFYLEVPVTSGRIAPYLGGKEESEKRLLVTSAERWIKLRKKGIAGVRAFNLFQTGLVALRVEKGGHSGPAQADSALDL